MHHETFKAMMRRLFLLFISFCTLVFSHSLKAQSELTTKTVYQIAWSPNGTQIVSVDYTNTVTIWDAKTQKSLLTISGISNNLSAIRWSPDGSYLAANSYDAKKVFIWDTTTGSLLQSIQEDIGSFGLEWTADDGQILTGMDGIDGPAEIRRWDAHTGKLIERYAAGGGGIFSSPDGKVLATVPSYWLELRDSTTLEYIAKLRRDTDYEQVYQVSSVAWSSDGDLIASGYLNGMVRLWDVKTSSVINEFKANQAIMEPSGILSTTVMALAFTEKDLLLSSVSRDGSIRQWDVDTGKFTLERQLSTAVTAADWSPDGKRLAVGSSDGTITIWENNPTHTSK